MMTMTTRTLLILAASGVLIAGFGANEATHGGTAEAVGLEHSHMFDYGGYHCATPDDAGHWEDHVEHMHGGVNDTGHHDHCGSGHMDTGHMGGHR